MRQLNYVEREESESLSTQGQNLSRDLIEPTTALLAHEIKNPLGSMKLFLSLLEQDLESVRDKLPQHTLEILSHIKTSIRAVDGVVTDALNFLVQGRLRIGVVNLRSLVEAQVEMIRPRCGKTALHVALSGNLFIQGDDRALGQAILNLLINSQEALGGGGKISITCNGESEEEVYVVIADDGPGVPDHLRDSIFSPRVTTKQNGNGFGLALVKRIVENHQGTIRCISNEGACMEMTLPRFQKGYNT